MAGTVRADEGPGAFVKLTPDIHHRAGSLFEIAFDLFLRGFDEGAQRGIQPVLNSGIKRVNIIEMPVNGAKPDLCFLGHLLAGRRGLAAFDQLEQRVDDFLFRLCAPRGTAIGFFDETDFVGLRDPLGSPLRLISPNKRKALRAGLRAFSRRVWSSHV